MRALKHLPGKVSDASFPEAPKFVPDGADGAVGVMVHCRAVGLGSL